MLDAEPFADVLVHSRLEVGHLDGARGAGLGVLLLVDAVVDEGDLVLLDDRLARDDAAVGRSLRQLDLAPGEDMPADGADGVGRGEHLAASGAFLRHYGLGALLGARLLADYDAVDRAVPDDVAAIVEDEAVRLPGVRREAESTANHLNVEAARLGGSQEDDAVDVRGVEAGGEDAHIEQILHGRLGLAEEVGLRDALEGGDNLRTLVGGGVAGHDGDAVLDEEAELLGDGVAVVHGGAKDDHGLAILRLLDEIADGGVDGAGGVDSLLDVLLDELAGADAKAREVDGGLAALGGEP